MFSDGALGPDVLQFIFTKFIIDCKYNWVYCSMFRFKKEYSQFVPVGNIANVFGILLILFAVMVGYVIYNPAYKRQEIQWLSRKYPKKII